jgi:hypothetical protein
MPGHISAARSAILGIGSQVRMLVTLYGKEKVYGSIP